MTSTTTWHLTSPSSFHALIWSLWFCVRAFHWCHVVFIFCVCIFVLRVRREPSTYSCPDPNRLPHFSYLFHFFHCSSLHAPSIAFLYPSHTAENTPVPPLTHTHLPNQMSHTCVTPFFTNTLQHVFNYSQTTVVQVFKHDNNLMGRAPNAWCSPVGMDTRTVV